METSEGGKPQGSFFALVEREVFGMQSQGLEDRAAVEFSPKPVAEIVVSQRFLPTLRRFAFPQKIPQKRD